MIRSLVFILTIVYTTIITIMHTMVLDNFAISEMYVVLAVMSMFTTWHASGRKLNLYFLYQLCFHLFIGGRFFVCLFKPNMDPFMSTNFVQYTLSWHDKTELMTYVFTCVYFITIGHALARLYPIKQFLRFDSKYINKGVVDSLGKPLLPILGCYLIYNAVQGAMRSFQKGYAAVDVYVTEQVYDVNFLAKIAGMLLPLFLAITFSYSKELNKKYLILYCIYGFTSLLSGTRAAFASALLLTVWICSMRFKVSIFKIGMWLSAGLIALLLIFTFTPRGSGDLTGFTLGDALAFFFHGQGISLMVFDNSRLVDNYPLVGYFQTFIPGFTIIYSKLMGGLPQYESSFEAWMCYNLNAELYANGLGLGWTTLSDLWLFSRGHLWLFGIFSLMLGGIMGQLENWSKKSLFFMFIVIAVTEKSLMMPRGYLTAFFVQLIYAVIFYILMHNYAKYKGNIAGFFSKKKNSVALH